MLRPTLAQPLLFGFLLLGLGLPGGLFPASAAAQAKPRIGVVSGPLGSFAATILKSHQQNFDVITNKTSGDSLSQFGLIVIDNLFRLQELNGVAFKSFVEKGGVLVVINPKQDGFSRTWSPYEIYIGGFTREAKVVDKKHPLFKGMSSDKLEDLADSNGPFVGNCSFAEPGKEWKVLAKAKKGDGAVILEAGFGTGWIVAACVRFDNYNAKPTATRLGDNLIDYALSKAGNR